MKMKFSIFVVLLFAFSFRLNAQVYSCNLAGEETIFVINPNKIIINFKENYTAAQRNSFIGDTRIDTLSENIVFQSGNTICDIKPNIEPGEIEGIILKINQLPQVEFAAPFLSYKDGTDVGISNEIIVKLKSPVDTALLRNAALNYRIALIKSLANIDAGFDKPYFKNIYVFKIPKENILNIFEIVNELQKTGLYSYAEPNFIRPVINNSIPNDPHYPNQWALPKMNLPNAWNTTTGNSSIKVAILDNGVDLTHPDLQGNLLPGYDATWGTLSTFQQTTFNTFGGYENNDAHGTSCAGIVASVGNNNIGVAGVAYNCKVIPIRIARSFGISSFYTDDIILADGIGWAWQTGADILSNSWGGGPPSTLVMNAISDANTSGRIGKGCPVLFSTGNKNNQVKFPATFAKTIAVGATNKSDQRCTPADWGNGQGSCYGLELDVAAPGVDIYSTDLQGAAGYNTSIGASGNYTTDFGGTSAACPFAAGVMALILSINPNLDKDQARYALESTCDKVGGYLYYNAGAYQPNGTWSNDLGYGRINAQAAVAYAQSLLPPVSGGPLSVSLTAPPSMCWGPNSYPKLTVRITGGTPHTNTSNNSKYYLCQFYDDASHTISSNTSMTYAYFSAVENTPTIINIDFPGGVPSFPFTKTYYLDVWGSDYVHHYNIATITVTINRNPTVSLAPDLFICKGVNAIIGLGATVSGGTPPYTYQWNPVSSNLTNPVAINCTATSMQSTENFTLTAIDNAGCSGSDQITVNVSQVTANAGPDKNVCINSLGQTIGLPATGGFSPYTYSWSPTTGLSNSAIYNPAVTVTAPGTYTYTVSVTDARGCTSSDQVTYSINNSFPTANAGADITVCVGGTVNLTGLATGNTGLTMTWSNGSTTIPSVSTGMQAVASVTPTLTTTYTFTVVDPDGCSATDQVTVTTDPALGPIVNAGPDLNNICEGAPILFTGITSGGTPPYIYNWAGGSSTPNNTYSYIPINSNQTIVVSVTDANGCKGTDNVTIYTVNPQPYVGGGLPFKLKCLNDPAVQLNITAAGGTPPYSYLWTPSTGLSDPTIPNPLAAPPATTVYFMKFTDAKGCQNTVFGGQVTVYKEPPPVAFSIGNHCAPYLELINKSINVSPVPNAPPLWLGGNEIYIWNFGASITPNSSTYLASSAWPIPNAANSNANILLSNAPSGYHDITLTVMTTTSFSSQPCYNSSITKSVYVVPTVATGSVATSCGTFSGTSITNDKVAVTVYNSCPTTITNGARATYIGGSGAVTLNPGFEAVPGSMFWAFIEEGSCMPKN